MMEIARVLVDYPYGPDVSVIKKRYRVCTEKNGGLNYDAW
jgi:hypothetical protein